MIGINTKILKYLNYKYGLETTTLAELYGTENFCIFMYSYCKMVRPQLVLEVGTGLATTSLLIATALKDNDYGKLITIDNGELWDSLEQYSEAIFNLKSQKVTYKEYILNLFEQFKLDKYITFINSDFATSNLKDTKLLDILFLDAIESDVLGCEQFLKEFLPRMSPFSSIFIDRAATINHSYLFLKYVIQQLNVNKIPGFLTRDMSDEQLTNFRKFVEQSEFSLIPLLENRTNKKNKNQNSRAWIMIQPVDYVHKNGVDNFMFW